MGTYIQHVKVRKVYLFKKRRKKLKKEKKVKLTLNTHARLQHRSTAVMPCNYSGYYNLDELEGFGYVQVDW